jgi:hypothetical protein
LSFSLSGQGLPPLIVYYSIGNIILKPYQKMNGKNMTSFQDALHKLNNKYFGIIGGGWYPVAPEYGFGADYSIGFSIADSFGDLKKNI